MKRRFTDIFICRPVLAMVISLIIFILGVKSLIDLQVAQYPTLNSTLITITTSYPGAPPQLIEGFITQQLERSVATSQGIDYMTSQSTDGQSLINIYIKLNYDPNVAFTDVMSKVAQVQNYLPKQAELPVIDKQSNTTTSLMFIAFDSKSMTSEQITDYIRRVVQPKLETVGGVSEAKILGEKTFAMRVWLDVKKIAGLGITTTDVANVLINNNFQSAPGAIKGDFLQLSINATTDAETAETFNNLVVKSDKNSIVRIRDIAKAELGSLSYDSSVYLNGTHAVFVAIDPTPTANPLTVITDIKKTMPEIEASFPPTLKSKIVYDATKYIKASIVEVVKTIAEATLIVIAVMFLFLGSLRAVIVPVVTIPLSMIGVMFFMYLMGYSLNLLTLLALVLAIGLVVDDAIVVVENVHRHIEEGMTPFNAAIKGAREIATAVIAMTITLAAVYAPIGFMTGLTGALFTEFAFTLAGSVIVSGIIALTLSPMMCSRLLNENVTQGRFVKLIDRTFERCRNSYQGVLHTVLDHRAIIVVLSAIILFSCFYFYMRTPSELAPTEDQGILLVQGTGPQYANITYVEQYSKEISNFISTFPAMGNEFVVNGMTGINSMFAGMIFKPWNERKESQFKVLPQLQADLNKVAGLQAVAFPIPPLPGSGSGLPVQFVLSSVGSFKELYQVGEKIKQAAARSGMFMYVDNSLKFDKPELIVNVDRNMAGNLGITMQQIGFSLAYAYGGNYVNWFPMKGQSYKVVPQMQQIYRLNPDNLNQLYLRTGARASSSTSGISGVASPPTFGPSGSDDTPSNSTLQDLVPLSTLATIGHEIQPNQLTHFQQLNSATIEGVLAPLVTMGQGLDFLRQQAKKYMSKSMTYNYAGQSRQFVQEGSGLVVTLFLSIIVIYLVLSAQFESFRDPFIILICVPMSICGALMFLNVGSSFSSAMTINIYTQIGLITLIGLISKHGILIVEFANQLQEHEGLSVREAIEKSATFRLRPVLMTTAAMVLGIAPLLFATGAGAQSRFAIGVVVVTGLLIGTCFTLFVVPTMYTLLAKQHQPLRIIDDEV